MQYFDEMITMYGFGNGGSVPSSAEACRSVYVRSINEVAERMGSKCQAVEYNRGGLHNWCLISFFRKSDLISIENPSSSDKLVFRSGNQAWSLIDDNTKQFRDEKMDRAISWCQDMFLDQYVEVKIVIDEAAFEKFLTDIDDESLVDSIFPVEEYDASKPTV